MAKRKIFDELIEGMDAMTQHREGKLTVRSYKVELTPLPTVDSKFITERRASPPLEPYPKKSAHLC